MKMLETGVELWRVEWDVTIVQKERRLRKRLPFVVEACRKVETDFLENTRVQYSALSKCCAIFRFSCFPLAPLCEKMFPWHGAASALLADIKRQMFLSFNIPTDIKDLIEEATTVYRDPWHNCSTTYEVHRKPRDFLENRFRCHPGQTSATYDCLRLISELEGGRNCFFRTIGRTGRSF